MNQDEISDVVDKGGVYFSTIIEIVGKPKDHVVKTMHGVVDKLKEDDRFTVIHSEVHDAAKVEKADTLWSAFADIEMIVHKFGLLYDFIFEFMPASIEIIEPEHFKYNSGQMTGVMNDFIGQLHAVDMKAKEATQHHQKMAQTLGTMVQNAILILLNMGPKSIELIAKNVGIDQEQLPRFLEKLEKDGKIEKEGDKYKLIK